jgi:hypothetical protein
LLGRERKKENEEEHWDGIDRCDPHWYRLYLASIWGIGVDDELNLAMDDLTINPEEESNAEIQNGYSLI